MKKKRLPVISLLFLFSVLLFSQDPAPRPWNYSVDLSYLGTGGNTNSHTLGGEFTLLRKPSPWGLEANVGYLRGDQNGIKIAERIQGSLKGSYRLDKRWDSFLSASWERDRFSGFDKRLGLAAGASYFLWIGERDSLLTDIGLSWNQDSPVKQDRQTYLGGMIDMKYTHIWSKTASFVQKLMLIPNFADSSRWHGESDTILIAGLTQTLALKGSFLLRYNHKAPEGFKKTDTTTALSLVIKF